MASFGVGDRVRLVYDIGAVTTRELAVIEAGMWGTVVRTDNPLPFPLTVRFDDKGDEWPIRPGEIEKEGDGVTHSES